MFERQKLAAKYKNKSEKGNLSSGWINKNNYNNNKKQTNSQIAQLAKHERAQNFAQSTVGERIRLVHVLFAHPILLGHGRALEPLFVIFPAMATVYGGWGVWWVVWSHLVGHPEFDWFFGSGYGCGRLREETTRTCKRKVNELVANYFYFFLYTNIQYMYLFIYSIYMRIS